MGWAPDFAVLDRGRASHLKMVLWSLCACCSADELLGHLILEEPGNLSHHWCVHKPPTTINRDHALCCDPLNLH